ncbi:NADH dehydrogenase [ubiquinone] iron-sulfur protein 6, mitochondrial [Meriones unguiculatus]|uniref:NADH dehydrogenase [ubiquinone] iron-sulfur protein 6, mitochondrial n=1 Tax=Meriones unguiculatus TaxID=10047 RepID=UPI000B4FB841|nr:NADH dehydrogenase [ubiquinone] iron-sulfur protein 6, mitochondrial [Meriones unguiculatus]XP_055453958.1 NADH dehydrogenase [ubiquinone] iron-sulfur protein 6, mitochondrial [Psammomys obesus]
MAAALTFRRLLALPRAARGFGVQVSPSGEKITHTGQVYDEKDYRRIRFVDRQKEVNENFAIDLIAEQPVNEVEHRIIACDGGGGALGHPKVYINLDKETKTGTCGYCGLQFKQHHH